MTGALLAVHARPLTRDDALWRLLWIVVAMVSARSAAMGFNRLADAKWDAQNPRTAMREIPRGAMSRTEASLFVIVSSLVFVFAAYELGTTCFLLSPVALPIRAMIPGDVSRGLDRIEALVPRDETLAQQDVVLVNAPFKYLCNFVSVVRRSKGGPSPHRWWCLGVSPNAVDVRREGTNTLVLRPESGYLASFEDTNVRSRRIPFAANDAVDLDGLSITVRAVTADARPQEIAARFDVPLESRALRWLVFEDGVYRAFRPPTESEAFHLPAQRFAWGDLLRAERAPP